MTWLYRLIILSLTLSLIVRSPSNGGSRDRFAPQTMSRKLQAVIGKDLNGDMTEISPRVFEIPVRGCGRALIIAITQPSFTPEAALLRFSGPQDRIFFAYLDWSSYVPDRRAILLRRLTQPMEQIVSASPYSDSSEMLSIVEPIGCSVQHQFQWDRFWTRGIHVSKAE